MWEKLVKCRSGRRQEQAGTKDHDRGGEPRMASMVQSPERGHDLPRVAQQPQ